MADPDDDVAEDEDTASNDAPQLEHLRDIDLDVSNVGMDLLLTRCPPASVRLESFHVSDLFVSVRSPNDGVSALEAPFELTLKSLHLRTIPEATFPHVKTLRAREFCATYLRNAYAYYRDESPFESIFSALPSLQTLIIGKQSCMGLDRRGGSLARMLEEDRADVIWWVCKMPRGLKLEVERGVVDADPENSYGWSTEQAEQMQEACDDAGVVLRWI